MPKPSCKSNCIFLFIRKITKELSKLTIFAFILIVWSLSTVVLPEKHLYLFPGPLVTFKALWASLPELFDGTKSSFLILLPGYLGATTIGIIWGLLVGTTNWLKTIFIPFTRVAAPIPPTIYVPYAIALLPTFYTSAIFIILLSAFWPVFINTAAGAMAIPERHRDNARVLGFNKFEYLRRVVFPAALPHIFNGANVGLGLSFIMLTVSELFGASSGLGHFVQYYSDFADYPKMVAGILYTGLVTFLSMSTLGRLERWIIFWPH